MLSLFTYVIINCIIFLFLIRKRFNVAAFIHFLLFGVLSVCFLFSGEIPDVLPILNEIFGTKNVLLLRKSLWGINGVISIAPLLLVELATILLAVIAYLIAVTEIVYVLSYRKSEICNSNSKKRYEQVISLQEYVSVSIFKLYCRYLC